MRNSVTNKIIYIIFVSLFSVIINGCASVYNPATQRDEFIFINTAQEVSLGQGFAQDIEQQLDISGNQLFTQRVTAIGQRLAAVSHRQDIAYHFGVVNDDEINAFAVPGGYIYIHTGLLNITDDDELACVIAHEIAHVAAKHSVKAMQVSFGYNFITSLLFREEKYQSALQASNVVFNIMHLNYSREDELFADKLGIQYAHKAGFDPQGMIRFFEKLKTKQKQDGSSEGILLLRSHPYVSQRIEAAKKEIDLLL